MACLLYTFPQSGSFLALNNRESQMLRNRVVTLVTLVTCIGLVAGIGAAQEFRGTITGRVVDAQSAAVPNAKVVAVLIATGAQSVTSTSTDGRFTIPFLAPGT